MIEQEIPESAALLRLSGMEVTECLSEVPCLNSDPGFKLAARAYTLIGAPDLKSRVVV